MVFKKGNHPKTEFKKGIKNPATSNYRKTLIGDLNPFYGKHHSEETKTNIKKNRVGKCMGENHWRWKGGVTPLSRKLRVLAEYQIWRDKVFIRDNFTCQNPDCKFCDNKQGVFIHPHHKKPISSFPELVFDVSNGVTYCKEFHLKSGLHIKVQRREAN